MQYRNHSKYILQCCIIPTRLASGFSPKFSLPVVFVILGELSPQEHVGAWLGYHLASNWLGNHSQSG